MDFTLIDDDYNSNSSINLADFITYQNNKINKIIENQEIFLNLLNSRDEKLNEIYELIDQIYNRILERDEREKNMRIRNYKVNNRCITGFMPERKNIYKE